MEIPIIKKLYELYILTHKLILKFPKHERYALGEKLENNIIEIMDLVIFGNSQPKNFKEEYVEKANVKLEILKIFYRMGFEIKAIEESDYLKTEKYLQETGRMFGGWIKFLKSTQ